MAQFGQKLLLSLLVIVASAAALPSRRGGAVHAGAGAPAPAAKGKKMAAVSKVVFMLEGLEAKVQATLEQEQLAKAKFDRFCTETNDDKAKAITIGKESNVSKWTQIAATEDRLAALLTEISDGEENIQAAESAMRAAEQVRADKHKEYMTNSDDLSGALEALENALAALKASKAPSLLQLQDIAQTVRTAVQFADALSLGSVGAFAELKRMSSLLQARKGPEPPMENYKFHADPVIAELEKLQELFRGKKREVDVEEGADFNQHLELMQLKTDERDALQKELGLDRAEQAAKVTLEAQLREEAATIHKVLVADQKYISELWLMCNNTHETYEQRRTVLQDELRALGDALAIIKTSVAGNTTADTIRFAQLRVSLRRAAARVTDPATMEVAEAEAETVEAPLAFLERSRSRRNGAGPETISSDSRHAAAALLREQGEKLHSAMLTSLAGRLSASGPEDPFSKVKQLIEELITRLEQEGTGEADHKGWCTKETGAAEQKRTYAAEEIERLNSQMLQLEADRARLLQKSTTLSAEIERYNQEKANVSAARAEEKRQNAVTVQDGEEGLQAVSTAKLILSKFYKAHAEPEENLLLLKAAPAPAPMGGVVADGQKPEDHAPDMPFKIGETYHGDQDTHTGIAGMLEVIASDFQRTIDETKRLEAEAQQEHLKFLTEIDSALEQTTVARDETDAEHLEKEEAYSAAKDSLTGEAGKLKSAITELLELKKVCVDTGMTYQDRVARREEEIAALQKALCILGDFMGRGEGC